MTSTTTPSRTVPAGALGVDVAPRRQRRWSLALVAALLVLGSALAFAVLWMNAGERRPVLSLARDVNAGEVLSGSDLQVVRVSADPGIDVVSSDDRDLVVGQTAVTDLVAGSLLAQAQLGDDAFSLEEGLAIVGVAIPSGKMPTPDLRTGNRVQVVQTGSLAGATVDADDEGAVTAVPSLGEVIAEGTVHGIEHSNESNGSILVSVLVDEPEAAAIAGASAAGQASLVLVP